MTQTAPKSPATKTYYANFHYVGSEGHVANVSANATIGLENIPASSVEELMALLAARAAKRILIADSRFAQRGYALPGFKPYGRSRMPPTFTDAIARKLWA